jgi:CBS domain-containing protein
VAQVSAVVGERLFAACGVQQPTLMRKAIGRPEDTVGTLMKRNFISMKPADNLLEADRIMRLARIRHLPVVEGGHLVGVLSHRDVLEASLAPSDAGDGVARANYLRVIPVEKVMQRNPFTADANSTLGDAARRMLRLKIGCLPVVRQGSEGEELIGLITESDLLRAAYAPDFRDASD